MVEPSRLADTVTPSSFCPVGETIAPLSGRSEAYAAIAASSDAAAKSALVVFIGLPLSGIPGRRAGRRHGSHVSDDGVGLVGLEVVLSMRHAVGAVENEGAHHVVVAAGRGLVEHRTVGLHAERGLKVADAAGLREDLPAARLRFVEVALREGGRSGRGE